MNHSERRDLQVLQEVSHAVLAVRDPAELLEKVLEILNRQLGMLRCTFTLREDDVLRIEASAGLDETAKRRGLYRIGEGITGQVAATRQPAIVPDVSKDRRFLNRTGVHKSGEHVSFLCVPILHGDQVVGTLSVERATQTGANLDSDLLVLDIVGHTVAGAIQTLRELRAENERLRAALNMAPKDNALASIVGSSSEMRHVYELIRQVAPSDATVLVRGGSGTGKELVASAIKKLSNRAEGPFIALNCAALPEGLVESELFGHEAGAFTGAVSRRIGRAEAADGGTLFLDEIGDLSLPVQVKLLRFLQERTFSRVGSNEELHADVRIIAATSRNLEEFMATGAFREDLYYRLNIFPIVLPALRHRRGDIIPLANHFLERANLKYGKNVTAISSPAMQLLMSYEWPGNVRELENCMERAVLLTTDDSIHGYNLPPSLQTGLADAPAAPGGGATFETLVSSYERELISEALKRNNGNMSAAAREIGLSPRVIHYKIHHLGIPEAWYHHK